MPWEQAIFVRAGGKATVLKRGIYFKIPFIDSVYKQTTRMRAMDTSVQTVSTLDGHAVTMKLMMQYSIGDILLLYQTVMHVEMTLSNIAMSHASNLVSRNTLKDISMDSLTKYINDNMNGEQYGLYKLEASVITFATVRTYRLIQDNSNVYEGFKMEETII